MASSSRDEEVGGLAWGDRTATTACWMRRDTLRKLSGGSVTLDRRLLLVADVADFRLVRDLVRRMGANWKAGGVRFGDREFVG
jgi:hypothetical protein